MILRLRKFIDATATCALSFSRPEMAELIKDGLERVAAQVFEGILITASSLINTSGTVPDELLDRLTGLAKTGVYVLIADDVGMAWKDSPNVFPVPIITPVDATSADKLAEAIKNVITHNGYRLDKALAVANFHRELSIDQTMKFLGLTAAFVTDFVGSDLDQREFIRLPIGSVDGKLLTGDSAVGQVIESLAFGRRINMREYATSIVTESIVLDLERAAVVARNNLESACNQLFTRHVHLRNTEIFDHHSGAVCFTPFAWRRLCAEDWGGSKSILDYFEERLPAYWQPGRPCLKRVLYTPTKVLLRGEQYYFHMKNISPIDRVREMCSELHTIVAARGALESLASSELGIGSERWKVGLAFLDQLRNIGLHFFSFAHAADVMLDAARALGEEKIVVPAQLQSAIKSTFAGDDGVHGFVGRAVGSYYYWLLGESNGAMKLFAQGLDQAAVVLQLIQTALVDLENWLNGPVSADASGLRALRIERLVRRWREADHPGENLLVVMTALSDVEEDDAVDAVGIGWGGIELPVIFRYLAELQGLRAATANQMTTYVANWSHYGAGDRKTGWVAFPASADGEPTFRGSSSIVFDDNVLTGQTLERIRDEMILRSARQIKIYVTRFSGERRLAHMKMENHGAVDPSVLLHEIRGYVGETPFARSWSTKKGDYTNQIGVFSLARRRILECIHNNSTVEAWDREGF